MLGQPMSMLLPQVIGFQLHGKLRDGTTATDLVLTIASYCARRRRGRFVESTAPASAPADRRSRDDRQHVAEFGSTVAIFRSTGHAPLSRADRSSARADQLVESYAQEQGLWHDESSREPVFTDTLELDLDEVESSLAGPRRRRTG